MLASAMLLWLDLDPIVICGLVAVAMWVAHAYFGCSLVADLCCGSLGTVFDHKHFGVRVGYSVALYRWRSRCLGRDLASAVDIVMPSLACRHSCDLVSGLFGVLCTPVILSLGTPGFWALL